MTVHKLIVLFVAGSLFVATAAFAEQKIIFKVDSFKLRGSRTTSDRCQSACNAKYGYDGDVDTMIKEGWRIVSSNSKEAVGIEDWSPDPSIPITRGCTCLGTQYVLQKDPPAPTPVPKVETPSKEVELLKKEIELQKQEITLLKQENETLKEQLKPKQKKK